jgi:isoleucyl-tRNA synthetase
MQEKKQQEEISFPQMEDEILKFWQKNKIFEKSIKNPPAGGKPKGDYVFYDGPPFITGLPHYATLLPSIAKDVVPRYWTMKGYRVERVWGWDCHGLPAENKVEEELGLKNKKDIEKLGVGKFINACRDYVKQGSEKWEWYINRIGRWVDMKNAYKTMDSDFMESVIWSFKKLYDDGFIYEGYRSSLHCPRCATPLSKFEITMDAGSYKDVTDKSVVVKFKLKNQENTYILAWTTTPWTLPGNLALAVGENIDYVKVKRLDQKKHFETGVVEYENLIIAKDIFEKISDEYKHEINSAFGFMSSAFGFMLHNKKEREEGIEITSRIEELKSKDLVGLEYEPLFDLKNSKIKNSPNAYKIYSADFVTTEDGTGIVHIAPNFGEDDFNLGQKENLPIVDIMDENGIYTKEAGEWEGLYFKKANTKALEELGNKLFTSFDFTHSYPFCYRCGTPLIYKSQKAWYLKIDKIREQLLETNKSINWVPEYFKEGRFKYNLENAPDWCLSRSRYWGSPIPVWKCENIGCNNIKVIGSINELKKNSVQNIKDSEIDLHKPNIDEVKLKCDKCGGEMKRVPEILDCWFESGSMPYAQWHYPFDRKDDFDKIFPADFIVEYTGQLRGWFYYLHVLSNCLFNSVAFKNVIVTGVLAGNDGRKMSKSLGNYPDPKMVLEKYGSDGLRMYFMNSSIMNGDDMNLSEQDIQTVLRKNVMLLWNVYKFYEIYASDQDYVANEEYPKSNNILDKWILARLNQLIKEVTENMDRYDLPKASRPITDFIDDLSTWYLRRSRDRFKGEDEKDKKLALQTTGYVLLQLSKIMAPFMPFIAEQVWQNIIGNNFEDENKSVHLENWVEQQPEHKDLKVIEEMNLVRQIVEQGLSARAEKGIKVRQPLGEFKVKIEKLKIGDELINLIKDELNVKEVSFVKKLESKDNWIIKETENFKIALNTKITHELELEGYAREIVRTINNLRKDAGLSINDSAEIYHTKDSELEEIFKTHGKDILKDTLCLKHKASDMNEIEMKKKVKIGEKKVLIGIKISN